MSVVSLSRRATLEVWLALALHLEAIEHEPGEDFRALLVALDVARRTLDDDASVVVRFDVRPSNVVSQMTQRELAQMHGVTERTIRRWKRSGRKEKR